MQKRCTKCQGEIRNRWAEMYTLCNHCKKLEILTLEIQRITLANSVVCAEIPKPQIIKTTVLVSNDAILLTREANRKRRAEYIKSKYQEQVPILIPEGYTYELQLEKQNGACAICKVQASTFTKRLAIDHNHLTGRVRGLLCFKCNVGVGQFKESIELLESACAYINEYQNQLEVPLTTYSYYMAEKLRALNTKVSS